MTAVQQIAVEIAEEDKLRARAYGLLAKLLSSPPSSEDLHALEALHGDGSPFGEAISILGKLAGKTTVSSVAEEYQDLFIGVGRGELVPFGSYYLTGFLNEKPLAKLRNDMARFGMARREGTSEPEDHVAAICEMMAGLITGVFDVPASLAEQQQFFETHFASWARHFFEDLEGARASMFYAGVGAVGKAFVDIEQEAFRMAE